MYSACLVGAHLHAGLANLIKGIVKANMDADAKSKLTEEELYAQMRWVHKIFQKSVAYLLITDCCNYTVHSSLQGMRRPRTL
jgi:hypothetical protein